MWHGLFTWLAAEFCINKKNCLTQSRRKVNSFSIMKRKILIALFLAVIIPSAYSQQVMNKAISDTMENIPICHTQSFHSLNQKDVPFGFQVNEYFSSLLITSDWPPRWHCGDWSSFHGWFYIVSDLLIWLSYFAIPAILFFFLYKKKEHLPFKGIFVFFIGFILLCGLTHLIDVAIFWWPAYRLSALIRFGTAVVSLGTVFALVKFIPRALELKSPDVLENIVEERTKELLTLNTKYELEILDRKNAEREVIRLNDALKNFRQAITNSSIISITDKSGIINYVNENFIDISGYDEVELIGKNHRIINSGFHEKAFWIKMWQTISKGQTWRAEVKNRAKDGSYYWVDTFIMPFNDEEGQINQYLSIRNDITDRKKAEEELRKLNNSLELIVEEKIRDIRLYNDRLMRINGLFESVQAHARIGVWEYEINDAMLYLSDGACKVLGYPENFKVPVSEILKLVPPDEKWKLLRSIAACLKSGEKYDFELLINTFSGQKLWVRTTGIPEHHLSDIVRVKGIIQNIDILKQKERELEKSKVYLSELNEELESFTYSVSHDLRAPLRYINGHANILVEDYAGILDKEGNEILQVIMNNTRKMGQLIDDLLSFSRLGRKEIARTSCNMRKIVRDIIQDHLMLHKYNNADISIKKLYPAKADYNMIVQVWINLISNAFKYSGKREKRKIEIGSEELENEILYYIKDNGVGFDPAYKHKLFGVFQRLHKVEEFSGTGVGLAIVHKIITRHYGKVWAESQKDHGATFYFTLSK
jgi:PAS domain S-box-containing protein